MKRITRELHVSRNTVRKILRSGETDFTYEREHQPLPKIGPWVEHVDRFLLANEGKAARERLTLIRIYEEVRALGYEGSYDAVRRVVSDECELVSVCPSRAPPSGSKKTTPLGQSGGAVQLEILSAVEGAFLVEVVLDRSMDGGKLL